MKDENIVNLKEKPLCPKCKKPMLMMYGAGWDYDRWICGTRGCNEEVELETSTFPFVECFKREVKNDKR